VVNLSTFNTRTEPDSPKLPRIVTRDPQNAMRYTAWFYNGSKNNIKSLRCIFYEHNRTQ